MTTSLTNNSSHPRKLKSTEPTILLSEQDSEHATSDTEPEETPVPQAAPLIDWESKETVLLNAKVVLAVYSEILFREVTYKCLICQSSTICLISK